MNTASRILNEWVVHHDIYVYDWMSLISPGSSARLDKALRLAQTDMFSMTNGARPARADVLIVIQAGQQVKRGNIYIHYITYGKMMKYILMGNSN